MSQITPRPRQRFILVGLGDSNDALEVTGHAYGQSIALDAVSWNREEATITTTLSNPTVRTIKLPAQPHGLWTRMVSWLGACPLRRAPDTTAYPVI